MMGLGACDLGVVRGQGPAVAASVYQALPLRSPRWCWAPVAAWVFLGRAPGAESTGCIGLPLPEQEGRWRGAQEDRSLRGRPRSW